MGVEVVEGFVCVGVGVAALEAGDSVVGGP